MDTRRQPEKLAAERANEALVRKSLVLLINEPLVEHIDARFIHRFLSNEFLEVLETFIVSSESSSLFFQGAQQMFGYLNDAKSKSYETIAEELNIDRTRLFKGVAASYGPPPPIEAEWVDSNDRDNLVIKKLIEEYRSSGMAVSPEAKERPDYLGVELEYYSHLLEQETDFWQRGYEDQALDILEKQERFLENHLNKWVSKYIEAALPYASTDFFRGHLLMVTGLLTENNDVA